ncbi:MAG TPA: peptidyl-prolyl cis-trans isomerase, partial [Anaeromyxobacteraceae bacterium]|nr:peptidyl-prolyl cis-trans isomerase [Anaeromyxobacteraceae bacterium]
MLSFLLYLVAAAGPAPVNEVVARVDDRAITAGAVQARLATTRGAAPQGVIQDLVNDTLLAAEAERQGLATDPGVLAEVDAQRRKLAAKHLVEKDLWPAAKVDEAWVRELYHSKADTLHLKAVTLMSEGDAKACLERLKKGAKLADEAQSSLEPRSKAGKGDLGTVARDELDPELAKAAFAAPLKTLSGPVKLTLGWAVFQVDERVIGDEKGFAERRAGLEQYLQSSARIQVRNHYLSQLEKEAGAQLDMKWIEGLGNALGTSAEQQAHVIATIWGKPLRYGDVLPEIFELSRGKEGGHLSGPRVKLEVIHQRVADLLLQEAAVRRGHDKAPELAEALAPRRVDALARAYAVKLRAQAGAPSDADVEAEYKSNARLFVRPGHRTCSQILVAAPGMADLVKKRIAGGEKFEEVARQESDDPNGKSAGGLIGEVGDDRLDLLAQQGGEPALAKAIREAKAGELAGPVKSKMGWHLLRCGPYQPPTPVPLAEVSPAIKA